VRFDCVLTNGTSVHAACRHILGSISSTQELTTHLRLLETSPAHTVLGTEDDVCGSFFAASEGTTTIGWIAIDADADSTLNVMDHTTRPGDAAALLAMATTLRLPSYFHWRNSSDPCRDRWSGIECRTDQIGVARVVVLDIHVRLELLYRVCPSHRHVAYIAGCFDRM